MTKEKGLPLTSNHWGTYRAKVKDGKIEELLGWEHDKDPLPLHKEF
jgi:biotin/methionine sulfoxide reductase